MFPAVLSARTGTDKRTPGVPTPIRKPPRAVNHRTPPQQQHQQQDALDRQAAEATVGEMMAFFVANNPAEVEDNGVDQQDFAASSNTAPEAEGEAEDSEEQHDASQLGGDDDVGPEPDVVCDGSEEQGDSSVNPPAPTATIEQNAAEQAAPQNMPEMTNNAASVGTDVEQNTDVQVSPQNIPDTTNNTASVDAASVDADAEQNTATQAARQNMPDITNNGTNDHARSTNTCGPSISTARNARIPFVPGFPPPYPPHVGQPIWSPYQHPAYLGGMDNWPGSAYHREQYYRRKTTTRGKDAKPRKRRNCFLCMTNGRSADAVTCPGRSNRSWCKYFNAEGGPKSVSL